MNFTYAFHIKNKSYNLIYHPNLYENKKIRKTKQQERVNKNNVKIFLFHTCIQKKSKGNL